MSRASWTAATVPQRGQAEAYAAIVGRIPGMVAGSGRPRESATPYLDRLAANAPSAGAQDVAAEVFAVALGMVGRAHAAVAADDLIRLAPEVHARRMSPLDVRNVAVARAARSAQAEKSTDLAGYTHTDVFELRPNIVAASPMLSPELIATVTAYTEAVYGRPLTATTRRLLDHGVPYVVELIESYPVRDAEPGAVLVSMQARQSGRDGRHLPTLYREQGMCERVAIALTRLLVGCDLNPQTAILWHALRGTPVLALPTRIAARLRRDISDLDQAQFVGDIARARWRRQLTSEIKQQWAGRPSKEPGSGLVAFGK